MGVINQARLSQHQFQLLVGLLKNLPATYPMYNLVRNIAQSSAKNNNIIIVRGVHHMPYDAHGPYHFNIRIQNRDRYDPTEHHVYVEPKMVPLGLIAPEISIDSNGTVTLDPNIRQYIMVYLFQSIPTLQY